LANGGYPGTFIENNLIYSPVIGGQLGYFSELFKVGTAPSIYLDARQNPRKIFIGGIVNPSDTIFNEYSGAFNNTNTNVYLDSTGKFSLGNKLSYDGTNLSVNGSITVTGGNAETTSGAQSKADTAISTAASDATTKANNAKNDAISTAASDATTKANNAKNDAISTASSDATSKSNTAFTNATAQVKLLADGGYSGSFIGSTTIYSPVVGGTVGYFSNQFRVGDAGIVLDGVNKRIYIGSGTYGNSNTGFYVDSTGNFSLGDKLSFNGSVLSINGSGTFSGDISAATGIFTGGISIGSGNSIFKADSNGIYLGNATFANAPFSVTPAGVLKSTSGTIGGWSIGASSLSVTSGTRTITLNAGNGFLTFGGDAKIEFATGGSGVIDFLGSGGIQMYSTTLGVGVTRADNAHRANLCVGTTESIFADSNGSGFAGYFVGPVVATGTITQNYSDERLKNKISNIPNAVDKIQKLNGFYYTNNYLAKSFGYKDDNIQIGVSAQEVKEVFPELIALAPFDSRSGVSESGENYMTVQYERLVPVLIEAIKELKAEIEELKKNK
jgi:hypothetical protein